MRMGIRAYTYYNAKKIATSFFSVVVSSSTRGLSNRQDIAVSTSDLHSGRLCAR